MIPISPTMLVYGVIALAVVGLGVAVKVQTARLDAAHTQIEAYKLAGRLAEEYAKKTDADNKSKKEKADADYRRSIVVLQRDNQRLRDSANSSSLPPTSADSERPDRIAFDRAELDTAIRGFTSGTAAIATEGAAAVNALDNAKAWAQSR